MFAFKIARRFLTSNKSQTFFIILGIAIGVSVQVFVGSLIQGLQVGLVNRTVGAQPQIVITTEAENGLISDWETISQTSIQNIDGINRIITAVDSGAFIMGINSESIEEPTPILLRGFDLESADGIYNYFDETTFAGNKPTKDNEVIIGINLQENLGIEQGQNITIQENPNPILDKFNLTVVGFFDLGVASLNELWIITQNSTVSQIFEYGNNVTSINIQIEDFFEADIIADEIDGLIDNSDIIISNWKAENQQLLDGLNGQTASSIMIQVFVIVSVVIGIGSVLAITVLQKSKQIGILKAMGVTDGTAALIFLFEGLLLGIGGAILGVSLGLGLGFAFTTFALDSTGKPIIDLVIDPKFMILSTFIAIIASMVSALIPAKKSTSLSIIEVIRNG
ncbi:ABC transporter permease [Candidatus Lokiarchaeum ossiferum]|uniref:ABC transporter permease n=1 Tax=Candidatus Lokiarchaeum ossiferum TaxID=2951803 RepID=UPI00352EFEB1